MKKRIAIMEKEKPDAVISIHQNSYHEESVSGPQVFYYNGSVEGKKMADIMQAQLIQGMKPEKERVAKENSSYYKEDQRTDRDRGMRFFVEQQGSGVSVYSAVS